MTHKELLEDALGYSLLVAPGLFIFMAIEPLFCYESLYTSLIFVADFLISFVICLTTSLIVSRDRLSRLTILALRCQRNFLLFYATWGLLETVLLSYLHSNNFSGTEVVSKLVILCPSLLIGQLTKTVFAQTPTRLEQIPLTCLMALSYAMSCSSMNIFNRLYTPFDFDFT